MKTKVRIARRAFFSAAHAYCNSAWTEEENRTIFGALYSKHGTGHNFTLEAQIEGPLDPSSGMIMNFKDLDAALLSVTGRLDHKHLNHDLREFSDVVPTTENIARFCFNELAAALSKYPVDLCRIRLIEGEDTWVEVAHTQGLA